MRSLFLAMCGLLVAVVPVLAADGVTVTGQGKVAAVPDAAQVSIGVITRNKDVSVAVKNNSKSVEALLEVVRQLKVEDKDIQTAGFSLSQEYSNEDKKQPVLIGFSVSNHVVLTVRNLDNLGKVLNGVIVSGANSVQGVQFLCTTKDALLDKARTEAVADAKRKAELYAAAAGVKLGVVSSIQEHGGSYGSPRIASAMLEGTTSDVPIARGQHTFAVTVSVTWSLENK